MKKMLDGYGVTDQWGALCNTAGQACVRFDSYTFVALVDRVVVRQDRTLEFIFRNGMKYEYIIAF